MTAKLKEQPMTPALRQRALDLSFARRALGKREARRLADIFIVAERDARAVVEAARLKAEEIFEAARLEADTLLGFLPDFAALDAVPAKKGKTALGIIRAVADKHGLSIAAVAGRTKKDFNEDRAMREAIIDVRHACPQLSPDEIGALFSGLTADAVIAILRQGK